MTWATALSVEHEQHEHREHGAEPNVFVTNYTPQLLLSSNLTLLAAQALTNDAAALAALYPALVVSPTPSNYLVNVFTTNGNAYYTNYPWDPVGTPAHLAFATNVTSTVMTNYYHTFLNAYLLSSMPNGWTASQMPNVPNQLGNIWVSVLITNVGSTVEPWTPVGSYTTVTNITITNYLTNAIVRGFPHPADQHVRHRRDLSPVDQRDDHHQPHLGQHQSLQHQQQYRGRAH